MPLLQELLVGHAMQMLVALLVGKPMKMTMKVLAMTLAMTPMTKMKSCLSVIFNAEADDQWRATMLWSLRQVQRS